jgi:lysophospholipase
MSAELVEIPENPRPLLGKSGIMRTRDGIAIRYALFASAERPIKGTVIILQGRNETIEKYFETVADLQARGFGVALYDLRGQGGSGRLLRDPFRGHVESFDDYVDDLEQFYTEIVLPDCRGPYFLLGHSTGSLIALLAAPRMVNRLERLVLVAPLLELAKGALSPVSTRRLVRVMWALGFGSRYVSGGPPGKPVPFALNKLTSDPERYRRNQAIIEAAPHLALGGPTAGWLCAALAASDTVRDPEFMARIHIPTLLIAPGADEVVSVAAIERYGQRLRCGSLLTIDGARHELLQEADMFREQFLAAFFAFVPGGAKLP